VTDKNGTKFFGKKTNDDENAYMPVVIYGSDGVTPISSSNPFETTLIENLLKSMSLG
jgi:hypothetical protein